MILLQAFGLEGLLLDHGELPRMLPLLLGTELLLTLMTGLIPS